MSDRNSTSSIGIFGCLFLIFIVLKLAEVGAVATWSWWWVTAPLWMPAVLAFTIWAVVEIVQGIARMFSPGWKE